MGQDINKIKKTYDLIAREYSEKFLGEHEKKPKDREILRRFSRAIRDRRPIWDFGCGPGQTAKFLHDLGVEISGLDLSKNILKQAKANYPEIRFQQGNILDLDFQDNSIAGIVAFYAMVHFTKEQVDIAFQEIFRVLQPGGLFLFTYHIGDEMLHLDEFLGKPLDMDFMFFTTDFMSDGLRCNGFEIKEIIERKPYPDAEYQSQRAYVFAMKPFPGRAHP